MWLSTWSLWEVFRRTAKVRCDGDHNNFWEAEMVILLPTLSSARWLEHILKDGEIQFQASHEKSWLSQAAGDLLHNAGSSECHLAYELSQLFPVGQRLRADRNSCSTPWVLAVRTQRTDTTQNLLRLAHKKTEPRSPTSSVPSSLEKNVFFFPILLKCPPAEEL